MTRYRYFLLSSVLQFPYSFNVQQYRFFFAPKPSALPPLCLLHRKSCRRPCSMVLSVHFEHWLPCMLVDGMLYCFRTMHRPIVGMLGKIFKAIILLNRNYCRILFKITSYTSQSIVATGNR